MLPGVQDTSGRQAGHVPSYSRNVVASRGSDACLTCWPWSVVTFTSDPRQRKTTNTEKSKQRLFYEFSLKWLLGQSRHVLQRIKEMILKKQIFKQPNSSTFSSYDVIFTYVLLLIKFVQFIPDKILFWNAIFAIIYHWLNWKTLHSLYFSQTVI